MIATDLDTLFTREALRPFQPEPGSAGLTPMLEILTPTEAVVFVLAINDFNDWDTRCAAMRLLGETCAVKHPGVLALRFGSEAWMRRFTPEEAAARGSRLVETYPDKTEVIIVFGQRATGEARIASARLYRRHTGEVERLGAWTVMEDEGIGAIHVNLLTRFWEGYRHAKGRDN